MKSKGKKISAIVVAAAVFVGSSFGCILAKETMKPDENKAYAEELTNTSVSETSVKKTENTAKEETIETKDEVVYVFSDANGKVNKVMDSIWLKKGESTKQTAEEANLPLDVNIKYTLDGKEVAPKDLAGKDGHLKIRMDFDNKAFEEKQVNGSLEKVYVPFIASAVTVFDGDNYSNVEVSTGKVAYDGARYAVVGLAVPGLKEDLKVKEDAELDIPDYIEMEADVTDCEITGMYLLVSNSVFNELKSDSTDEMDDLKDNINKITDAVDQLMDGSDKLYDGLDELLEGADKLSNGVTTLSDGLGTIDSNSEALRSGAKQVFETLLATASDEMRKSGISVGNLTIDNYAKVLTDVINQGCAMGPVREGVTAEVERNNDAIVTQVTMAVKEAVVKQKVVEAITGDSTKMNYIAGLVATNINAATGSSLDALTVLASLSSEDPQMAPIKSAMEAAIESAATQAISEGGPTIDYVRSQVDLAVESGEPTITGIINAKVNETKAGLIESNLNAPYAEANTKISNLKASLDKYNEFYQGINAYTEGVGTAYNGSLELKKAMPDMIKGITALRDGSGELSDGIHTFNDEAIGKITDMVDDTLDGLVNRFNAVTEVSKNYKAYDENGDPMEDGVKFIIKVDSVRK